MTTSSPAEFDSVSVTADALRALSDISISQSPSAGRAYRAGEAPTVLRRTDVTRRSRRASSSGEGTVLR